MKIFKTALSIMALVVVAVGGAQAAGAITWNAAVVDLITAGGGVLAVFGITPVALPTLYARLCGALATLGSMAVVGHANGSIPGAPKLFNVIAVTATLVGTMGRFPQSLAPFPEKAGVQPGPPPRDKAA